VAVAWPYVNGPPHLGHIAGNTLPADIFARYHRLAGNNVLMVSGSDQHGTPVAIRAREEGVPPGEIAERYHRVFAETNERMGFSFDLYTRTGTDNHRDVVHDIFSKLLAGGYLVERTTKMPFCEVEQRFLSDRFVEGTCPYCEAPNARGDQCDACGKTLDPVDLLDIHCRADGSVPVFRDTTHYFFRLSAFQERLEEWVSAQKQWRPNVRNMTLGMLREGLRDRAITRDIDWGVSVPVEGYESKRIYVWLEAVIGYLSASKEWAKLKGDPEAWRPWWEGPNARCFYFQGKDNIPFHTIIWPAALMGYGGLNLPYDVPANEFLTLEGRGLSTSQNWAIWLPDYLERYEPDPLRYYLSAIMPETSDSDFSWAGYVRRNNNELVATLGNFVHRVLTITGRNFNHRVPQPGELDDVDRAALAACDDALADAAQHLEARRLRDGLHAMMALAQHGNRYVDRKAPWATVKNDRTAAATTLWTALSLIATLRTLSYPYLPFSAEKMHALLGLSGDVLSDGWKRHMPEPGSPLPRPRPLFKKLDESVVQEETARLKATRPAVERG